MKVGAATWRLYVAKETGESAHPDLYAMALIVALTGTLTGTEYSVPTVLVGIVIPSVV